MSTWIALGAGVGAGLTLASGWIAWALARKSAAEAGRREDRATRDAQDARRDLEITRGQLQTAGEEAVSLRGVISDREARIDGLMDLLRRAARGEGGAVGAALLDAAAHVGVRPVETAGGAPAAPAPALPGATAADAGSTPPVDGPAPLRPGR